MSPETDPRTAKVVQFYEHLTPRQPHRALPGIYAEQATFKDPFNEVRGLPAIHTRVQPHVRNADPAPFCGAHTP
jgi:hypothetical protein